MNKFEINVNNKQKENEFIKGIYNMFDSIWDCEIEHPVFEDTVGELMEAVIELYKSLHKERIIK